MITNETEIRIALQALLVSLLALYGFWGCAFVVLLVLLPWKPFLVVGGYLAQPLVDWRLRKARDRHEKGIAQIEKELDQILNPPKEEVRTPPAAPAAKEPVAPSFQETAPPPKPFQPAYPHEASFGEIPSSAHNLAATLEIPAAIEDHVRNLPQGAFSNMDLEIEQVKFNGNAADAYVRFRSSLVRELAIRQCYHLRKSNGHWQVESRQPANGGSKAPHNPLPSMAATKAARVGRA